MPPFSVSTIVYLKFINSKKSHSKNDKQSIGTLFSIKNYHDPRQIFNITTTRLTNDRMIQRVLYPAKILQLYIRRTLI